MPANRRTYVIRVTLEDDPPPTFASAGSEEALALELDEYMPVPHVVKVEITKPDGSIHDVTSKVDRYSLTDADVYTIESPETNGDLPWGMQLTFDLLF